MTRDAAARFLVTTFNSEFGQVFLYFYFIALPVAAVLMRLPSGEADAYHDG